MDDSPIRTPRLDLPLFSLEFEQALLAGDASWAERVLGARLPAEFLPDEEGRRFLRWKRQQVEHDPLYAPWSMRVIVLRADNLAIGTTNFHGPPGVNDTSTPSAAEVGYTILEAQRSRGFATEVAEAMLAWARSEHGVHHFISAVRPDNTASLRVNEKLGFAATGEISDEEIIFALRDD